MDSLRVHLVLLHVLACFTRINCAADVGEESRVETFGEIRGILITSSWHSSGLVPFVVELVTAVLLMVVVMDGLWPDYNDGTWPACCSSSRFDPKEISTLGDALHKYWPSLSCSSPSTCHGGKGTFWAHEWEKHGTCSSSVTRDEHNYFLTTLNVYFKYNVTKVLNEAGYVPSNSEKYPIGGIIAAIQNAFHATPEIQCKGGAIEELHICFHKNFTPRDCATEPHIESYLLGSRSSCPKYISLPAIERVNQDLPARGLRSEAR